MSDLKPCPFCGAGTFEIRPNGRMWLGMKYSEPASVSVLHWCEATPGQPSRVIERVGRDEASAIEAWNRRAQPAQEGQVLTRALTLEQCVTLAKLAGIRLSPAQFSGVLEAEVSEFDLQTFANLCIGIVGKDGV